MKKVTTKYETLSADVDKQSRWWISDAVINEDDVSDACDDFVNVHKNVMGRPAAKRLANLLLEAMGEEPIYAE